MKLYHSARSSAAYRVRIALACKGIPYESRLLDMQAMQHASPQYRSVNPAALVPALDVGERVLSQSLAIIEYLEETHPLPSLLPSDPLDRAYVRALSQLIACEIHPLNNLRTLNYVRNTYRQDEQGIDAWYRNWIADGFAMLESYFAREKRHGVYCNGNEVSMADCCLIPQVANAKRYACNLDPYPTIMRINDACVQLAWFVQASPDNQAEALWLSTFENGKQ